MKKIFTMAILSLCLMSCSEEEPNCDCDKVVATNYSQFNIPGSGSVWMGSFTTINECSGLQQTWSVSQHGRPRIGECK
jgi:hypothetical protein